MSNYYNNDSGGEQFDDNRSPADGLDLLTDPIKAAGEPVDLSREAPSGELVEADPPATEFGVDRRSDSGEFVSKDQDPTTLIRHDDGEIGSNPFAVGNFGAFDEDFRYSSGDSP